MSSEFVFSVYAEGNEQYLASAKSWFNAYQAPEIPAWSPFYIPGSIQLVAVGAEKLEVGGVTNITAKSQDMALLGLTATLTVDNPFVADSTVVTATMEPDALGGVQALFLVAALSQGESTMQVEVE